MNRGSGSWPGSSRTRGICFNEAPIHESGKWWRLRTARLLLPRFNEAPIHESGKFERRLEMTGAKVASMRPRFMNRGSSDKDVRMWRENGVLQ